MKLKNIKHLAIKLPSSVEVLLYLIREELKCRKFFNSLRELGLDNCHYQPNLDELIMTSVGLTDNANETYDFYYTLIEKHSQKIGPDEESISQQAFKVYMELMIEKNRRCTQSKSNAEV